MTAYASPTDAGIAIWTTSALDVDFDDLVGVPQLVV